MASLQQIQSRRKAVKNYAFIDAQNLNLGVRDLGWKLDFQKFRVYLRDKYDITSAYIFIGFIDENQSLYTALQNFGYILVFKPILEDKEGKPKGNVDADLVLHTMIEYDSYDKAVIVSGDGDFYSLVEYLYETNKLEIVLAPNRFKCSILLKRKAKEKIDFLNKFEEKLGYVDEKAKKKRHR